MEQDQERLQDILKAISTIEEITQQGETAFLQSRVLQSAVLYNFLVIGEAVTKISGGLKEAHPEVKWKDVKRFPNVLIHGYMYTDLEIVWGYYSIRPQRIADSSRGNTMGIEQLLKTKRQEILERAEKYGAYNVRVFGSVARGEAQPDSDVDFLVDVRPGIGLGFFTLWNELEDLLGREVDLVPERSLRESLRERVLSEAMPL